MDKPLSAYWKTPGREVYNETFRQMFASIVLCYVVYKLDPPRFDPDTCPR